MAKKGLGIKMLIWFPNIKSQKFPWITCVKGACNISLESFWERLQLCFIPHLNHRSSQKTTSVLSGGGGSQFWEIWDSQLENPKKNDIWVQSLWPVTKNTIRKKVVASPKFKPWWVLWLRVCMWFVRVSKLLQLCTNQLIVWFV